jgi:protein TonB
LDESEDAESLKTIRDRFPRLDDFVANLEPDMWVVKTAPEASHRTQGEVEALVEEIQKGLRSRLLALATELERGTIVHHRAFRVNQLNQLRDQAINELRSQAGVEEPPPTLPGPEAHEWIEWAFGLNESDDAESLKTLRDRFPRLDDFVANLEPDMWIASGSPPLEIVPEPKRPADHQEQSQLEDAGWKSGTAEVFDETSTAPAIASDILVGVEKPWGKKWWMLLVIAAVLVSMLALAPLGFRQWRSRRNHTGNDSVKASERKMSDLPPSQPENRTYDQSGISTGSDLHISSPNVQTKKQSQPKDKGIAPEALSTAKPAKQADKFDDSALRTPVAIPKTIAVVTKEEAPPNGATGLSGTVPGGVQSGSPSSAFNIVKDIPVVEPKLAARISSGVAQGLLIRQVNPSYPSLARNAHIEGTVVLHAVIGRNGTVQSVTAVQGHPLLIPAAMDAVKRWLYKPYYLNGEPVAAQTEVIINFRP